MKSRQQNGEWGEPISRQAYKAGRRSYSNAIARCLSAISGFWRPALLCVLLSGCDTVWSDETVLFQRAETSYTHGDYDGANELYRRFLQEHPQSPLAPMAEQRLRTIERELDAVMGRRGAPAPIRVNPYGGSAAPEPEEVPIHIAPPRIQTLGESSP